MKELSIAEMEDQSATVLPERAALGVFLVAVKIKAVNVASAYQTLSLGKNTAVATQVISVG